MFAQFEQQVKDLEEFAVSVSSAFDSSKTLVQDIRDCQSESKDKLKRLEEMKSTMEEFANIQKDVRIFQDAIVAVKDKLCAEDTSVTALNIISVLDSDIARLTAASTINPEQSGTLSQLEELFNSIKATLPVPVEDEEDITVTNCIGALLDPISRKTIENPVKNIVCGHIYEKTTILFYLNSSAKVRKCPYGGCANQNLRVCDIVNMPQAQTET